MSGYDSIDSGQAAAVASAEQLAAEIIAAREHLAAELAERERA